MAAHKILSAAELAKLPRNISIAQPADLTFVCDLQRRHSGALGYLPRAAIEWYIAAGMVFLADQNGQDAGYFLGRPRLKYQPLMRPIYQAAVAMDAQRRHVGLDLVARIAAEALAANQLALQALCASDLESNSFWKAAGFRPIAILTADNARGRDLICWRLALTPKIPVWFIELPPRVGSRQKKIGQEKLARHFDDANFRGRHFIRDGNDSTSHGRIIGTTEKGEAGE